MRQSRNPDNKHLPFAGLWVFNADELLLDSDSFSTLCLSSSIVSIISSLLFTRATNSSIISFSRAFSESVTESGSLEIECVYKSLWLIKSYRENAKYFKTHLCKIFRISNSSSACFISNRVNRNLKQ